MASLVVVYSRLEKVYISIMLYVGLVNKEFSLHKFTGEIFPCYKFNSANGSQHYAGESEHNLVIKAITGRNGELLPQESPGGGVISPKQNVYVGLSVGLSVSLCDNQIKEDIGRA